MAHDGALAHRTAPLCAWLRGDEVDAAQLVDWDGLVQLAVEHRVHLLLADELTRRATVSGCPEKIRNLLRGAIREAALIERAQTLELQAVLEMLAEAGVSGLLLKGVPLASTHYAKPYLRPRLDVDILIRRDHIGAVGRVMERVGYTRHHQVQGEHILHQFQYDKTGSAGIQHSYDFHWRIANPELFADLLSVDELDRTAIRVPDLGIHARAPDAVHALLLACVHRVAHHNDSEDLIWLYDIHLLASRMTEADWGRFEELAATRRVRTLCGQGLARAAQAFRTRVPTGVADALGAASDEPSTAFLGGQLRQIDIQLSNFRSLPEWRARRRLALEHLFPAPAYMLTAYRVASRAWLPLLYAHRAMRGAMRWLRPLGPV